MTKPRYGWRYPEGYSNSNNPYTMSEKLRVQLKNLGLEHKSSIRIEDAFPQIEKAIQWYMNQPVVKFEDTGPTPGEQRAAARELKVAIEKLLWLLSPDGLDSKTRQFVDGVDETELIALEQILKPLHVYVSHGCELLDSMDLTKVSRDSDRRSLLRFILVRDVRDALKTVGIPWKTTRGGYCELIIKHIFDEIGHPIDDAQHIIRAVLNKDYPAK